MTGSSWRDELTKLAWFVGACIALVLGQYLMNRQEMTPDQAREVMRKMGRGAQLAEGRAALESQDLDRAIATFSDVIHQDPKCAEAYYYRGVAYGKKGDQVRALADRVEALRLNPALAKDGPR